MSYAHLNVEAIEDLAPSWGVDSLECRPVRTELGAERIGLTHYTVKPGRRVGFGHNHQAVEEAYFVAAGSGRFKLEDEIVDVAPGSVVYCSPEVMREWEAGDDGLTVVAFGEHKDGDGHMQPGWWVD